MDPKNRGPEDFSHNDDSAAHGSRARDSGTHGGDPRDSRRDSRPHDSGPQRPPRDVITADFGHGSPALARTVQLVSDDLLLTVNPVDGSEVETCPPAELPGRPERNTPEERAELLRAAKPPVPPGPPLPAFPLLERQEERERLVRLLARGRSVRLVGPGGSGRTALLDAVAEDCADLAPDGLIRLSGYRRGPLDLLHELCATVYAMPLYRPGKETLLELVRGIGAVVVLDDLEFGGAQLGELLDATPECAFLLSALPDVPAPSADSHVEDVFLGALGRSTCLDLLERAANRELSEDEVNWAGDLWFESEGLPLRFVQAGALLRQRDDLRSEPPTVFTEGRDVPLPTLAEGAAPAALLASRLSESARETLRLALALDGELPHPSHLPALVGDTHADAALAELVGCGLVSPAGSHFRLASGVPAQLEAAGFGDGAAECAHTAGQHYAWWAGHASVTPERAAAECDAVLAALGALVPGVADGHAATAVQLARAAAPAFAAGMHWSAWERALRHGQEAARISGEVADEAYFHHELGVLALCTGNTDRARVELEASIGLRGALADKRGTVAGRRALALVADRSGGGLVPLPAVRTAAEEVPDARYEESASPPSGIPAVTAVAALPPGRPVDDETVTVVAGHPAGRFAGARHTLLSGARRNVAAAGAGAMLIALLGTVVTLGATSDGEDTPSDRVTTRQSANPGEDGGGLPADGAESDVDSTQRPGGAGASTVEPGASGTVSPSGDGASESGEPTGSSEPGDGETTGGPSDRPSPTRTTPRPSASSSSSKPPTSEPPTSEPPTESPTSEPSTGEPSPPGSASASGPESSASVSSGAPESSPESGTSSASGTVI
ncbi:ATP-binding protein [Streptomyces sp. GC420]|uniref:ATP-binding protein n=1 Tax=Streptomyces sp. GC420 TaxID=2697568 RepID=UPI0014150711|nr:ATP-binding protein [Streptomyces sp. GC420]NBM14874.1 ATP-binding protein [Streptomyces sp. GC420]